MASSRDVQEIVAKLSSDKAKTRDEGIKLLNNWMEGERSIGFCKLLAQNTSRIRPGEIPHSETWPFLITLLMKCITLEIAASKRRPPKLVLAKTLRTVIQRAEHTKSSGKTLFLFSVIKALFNHIWDVIKDVPTFQSEYSIILRHLLAVKEYRYEMRKRVLMLKSDFVLFQMHSLFYQPLICYCLQTGLVLMYMNKVQTSMCGETKIQSSTKEEVFRCILMLHVLLESPPDDFPDALREDLVKGFMEIFSQIREEGEIPRKVMECINTYLLKDGPNLGCQAMEIHSSLQDFICRCCLTTHDRGLKNSLILYAKVQLNLNRNSEGGALIEQLFDVIGKELDQSCIPGTVMAWSDATRDDKLGALASSQQGLVELSASVLYWARGNTMKTTSSGEKRLKRQGAADRLKDDLMKGKWLWDGIERNRMECAYLFVADK